MGNVEITRKLEFDAGHRVLGHEGKCAHLHGHRYMAEITIQAPRLDTIGRVIDFSAVKSILGKWIDDNWDHNIILHPDDPLAELYLSGNAHPGIFANKEPFLLKTFSPMQYPVVSLNPTAENLASYLFWIAKGLLPGELKMARVRLYETPNCWADYNSHLST